MNTKGLLIVSFGTTFPEALERDIVPVEEALAAAFPDRIACRAFSSRMIIKKLAVRDRLHIDTVAEALDRLAGEGVSDLLIQPTFLIHGLEYDLLTEAVRAHGAKFASVRLGRPLLSLTKDYQALTSRLKEAFPEEKGHLLLMGHGTEHYANAAYPALDSIFRREGCDHIHIGTVEGYPDLDTVIRELQEDKIHRVTLMPLMLVAGDHANNDMASDEPDSWKSRLAEAGIIAECILRGLGSWPFIRGMFVSHAVEAEQITSAQ